MKNRLIFFICILIVSFYSVTSAYAYKTDFFTSVMDLPLVPGFTEAIEDSVIFDKPSGRIIVTEARGHMTSAKVQDFYNKVLPQLGWVTIGEGRYVREDELLELKFSANSKETIIHVILKPMKG